jgi:hypothetical protein
MDVGPTQFVIDEELVLDRRGTTPRLGPRGSHESRLCELTSRGVRVLVEPPTQIDAARIEFVDVGVE